MSVAVGTRGHFKSALTLPRLFGLAGSLMVLVAVTGILRFGIAGAEPVAAGGACSPNTSYTAPVPLTLADTVIGLTVADDGVATYGVGGSSVEMIRGALARCAPDFTGTDRTGEYLAYTSYAVNWSYQITRIDATTCRLDTVKIGLHLSQLLPRLESEASPQIGSRWSSFMAGLKEHEDGHKAVDIVQARSLLNDLRNLRAPCADIDRDARNLTVSHLADFVTANADHDHDTDYGRDQGAQW